MKLQVVVRALHFAYKCNTCVRHAWGIPETPCSCISSMVEEEAGWKFDFLAEVVSSLICDVNNPAFLVHFSISWKALFNFNICSQNKKGACAIGFGGREIRYS